MATHITIVEDDEDIAALVAYNLEREGWKCTLIHHGTAGWDFIRRELPDCVILDMMLPGMNGLEIFREMKSQTSTRDIPALFLTARAELDDRLAGLSLGADDYITKPFSCKELVLRVKNILNRVKTNSSQLVLRHKGLLLDKITHQATLHGKPLELTGSEFKLLVYLMERPGKAQDRYELQHRVLGHADTTQTRALDTHIKRLRQKLGACADCIVTERGEGYLFSPEALV